MSADQAVRDLHKRAPFSGRKIGHRDSPWFFLYRLEVYSHVWEEWRMRIQSPSRDTLLERTKRGDLGSWGNEEPWVRGVVWLCRDGKWMRGRVAWVVQGAGTVPPNRIAEDLRRYLSRPPSEEAAKED